VIEALTDARAIALELVARPSVSGTADEARFGPALAELLAAAPYFRRRPQDLRLAPVEHDPVGRSNVFALFRGRGRGRRTVVLSGHYDTVGVEDFGALAELAHDPLRLREALVARPATSAADARLLEDLRSGDFLPGRGMLDMKSGLAAAIAVAGQHAADEDAAGNLLLVATADEETDSRGMRAAARQLPGLAAAWDLELVGGVNLDATAGGEDEGTVALGTPGKLLLSAYVLGDAVHGCYPLSGTSGASIAVEVARALEGAGDVSGAGTPPPVLLSIRDLKPRYDITTPGRVWCLWNVITHDRRVGDVIADAVAHASSATASALERWKQLGGAGRPQPTVLTFAELEARALAEAPAGARDELATLRLRLASGPHDVPGQSRLLTERLIELAGLTPPAVVLGVAAPPYAAAGLDPRRDASLLARLRDAVDRGAGPTIAERPFLPVVSDISFLSSSDPEDAAVAAANTPVRVDELFGPTGDPPRLPMVNAGPWGRDYHGPRERVHAPYAFETLPRLVAELAHEMIRA